MANLPISGFRYRQIARRPGLLHRRHLPFRFTIHTTEGSTASGAFSAYDNGTGPPHVTTSFEESQTTHQHIRLDRGAYALRNNAGGSETNAVANVQIEVVGRARDSSTMSTAKKHHLADVLYALAVEAYSLGFIGPHFSLRWPQFYDESAGFVLASTNARQRKTVSEWESSKYTVYGHQHIGEGNHHWDPGALDMVSVAIRFNAQWQKFIETAPSQRPLARGSAGPFVAELQHYLHGEGHAVSVDGEFGPQTEQAVKAWQAANSQETIGRWDTKQRFARPAQRQTEPREPELAEIIDRLEKVERKATRIAQVNARQAKKLKSLKSQLDANDENDFGDVIDAAEDRIAALETRFGKLRRI